MIVKFSNKLSITSSFIDNFIELKIIEPDGQWIKKEQLEELQKEFKDILNIIENGNYDFKSLEAFIADKNV